MLALRPAAQGPDEERCADHLKQQVTGDEQPSAPAERVVDCDRHEQAGEHQPDEQHAHRQPIGVEPVRPPCGHVPGVVDGERQNRGLGTGPQVDVLHQMVRELPDREDVDQVEEELERADAALGVGCPRDGDPHPRDPMCG